MNYGVNYIFCSRYGMIGRNVHYNKVENHIELSDQTFYMPLNNGYLGNNIIRYGFNTLTLTVL